jgi:hypothetical protein
LKAKKEEKDDYLRNEALDRTSLLMDMLHVHLFSHPFIRANPKYENAADKAIQTLSKLCQQIEKEHLR